MMKATFPFLCLCMMVPACSSVHVEPVSHQREVAHSLTHLDMGANDTIRQAVKSGDYIVVEYEGEGHTFYYKGKAYPDAASITPDRKVDFVYFYGMFKDETITAVLSDLCSNGVDVPYIVRCHNGIGNIVSDVSKILKLQG